MANLWRCIFCKDQHQGPTLNRVICLKKVPSYLQHKFKAQTKKEFFERFTSVMSDLDAKTQLSLVDYLVLTVLDGVGKSARLDLNKITNMWSFPFFALHHQQLNFKPFPLVSTGNCFKLIKVKTALITVSFSSSLILDRIQFNPLQIQ